MIVEQTVVSVNELDTNGDGKIDIEDVTELLRRSQYWAKKAQEAITHITEVTPPPPSVQMRITKEILV